MPGWADRLVVKLSGVVPARLRVRSATLSVRLTVAMVMLVIMTAGAVAFVMLRGIAMEIVPLERDMIATQVRTLGADLANSVAVARAEIRNIVRAIALREVVGAHRHSTEAGNSDSTEALWRTRLATRFAAQLNTESFYLQYRYIGIDDGGREIVRVDRSGSNGSVRVTPDEELQQKGNTDYFKSTLALRAGEIYISPIDLNREHGEVQVPHIPVLRVATPVFDDAGIAAGVLVANMDMRPILERIGNGTMPGGRIVAVNADGDYLIAADRAREFGFDLGRRHRIQDDFPDLTAFVNSSGDWSADITDRNGERQLAAATTVAIADGNRVTIIDIVPYSTAMAPVAVIRSNALLAGLFAAICAALLAGVIARSLTEQLRQTTAAIEAFKRNEPMRLPEQATGEIGILVNAFKEMADGIRNKSQALKDFAKRETLYAAAIHSSNFAFFTVNTDHRINGWNPGAEQLFGYSAAEAIGQDVSMIVPEDRNSELPVVWQRLVNGEHIGSFSTVRLRKNGEPVHVIVDISPLKNGANEMVGASAILRDATDLRAAEELFGLAVEACPSGMVMTNTLGQIIMVNGEIERLFGYERGELLNRPIEMLVPLRFHTSHEKLRAAFIGGSEGRFLSKRRDLFGRRKDGTEFPAEIVLNSANIRDELLVLAVILDITERVRAERLKDEFVSTVSHELRTPLTSITASLALLSAGGAGELSSSAARLIAIANDNGERLVRLINDILDIQKMNASKAAFNIGKVSAIDVAGQAVEISLAYADRFGVKLRLEPTLEKCEVRTDADRLAQVIGNLLSNAIKFSPSGEEVVVSVVERERTVRITVRDHGAGIPDEFKPHIFERFAQADGGDTKLRGGTGLGLSIVKQIVDLLGGEVGFESAVGHGTLFYVEIEKWQAGIVYPLPDDRPASTFMTTHDKEMA
jgi:PAS domain S-box-containing protein